MVCDVCGEKLIEGQYRKEPCGCGCYNRYCKDCQTLCGNDPAVLEEMTNQTNQPE